MHNPIYCLTNRFKDGSKEVAFLSSLFKDCCACLDNGIICLQQLLMMACKHAIYWMHQS